MVAAAAAGGEMGAVGAKAEVTAVGSSREATVAGSVAVGGSWVVDWAARTAVAALRVEAVWAARGGVWQEQVRW